jgi:predicted Ser/Thr protein kinase
MNLDELQRIALSDRVGKEHVSFADECKRVVAEGLASARSAGREQAAKYIDSKVSAYVQEFGAYDPSTGQTEFTDAGEQYLETLEELAEEIRNLGDDEVAS